MGVYHTLYKCIRLNCHLFDQELGSTSASPHQSLSFSNIVSVVDHFQTFCRRSLSLSMLKFWKYFPRSSWSSVGTTSQPMCSFRYYQHEDHDYYMEKLPTDYMYLQVLQTWSHIDQHCFYEKIIIWSGWGWKLLWRPSCPYQSYPATDKGVTDDKANHVQLIWNH